MRLVVLFLLLGCQSAYAGNTYGSDIEFNPNQSIYKIDRIKYNSYYRGKSFDVKSRQYEINVSAIRDIYNRSILYFFGIFEKKLVCSLEKVTIFIVEQEIITNRVYFSQAAETNFGRYFYGERRLYISDDFLDNPEYLAHELAHYFYDECEAVFSNQAEEHKKVYRFQKLFKRAYERQ